MKLFFGTLLVFLFCATAFAQYPPPERRLERNDKEFPLQPTELAVKGSNQFQGGEFVFFLVYCTRDSVELPKPWRITVSVQPGAKNLNNAFEVGQTTGFLTAWSSEVRFRPDKKAKIPTVQWCTEEEKFVITASPAMVNEMEIGLELAKAHRH